MRSILSALTLAFGVCACQPTSSDTILADVYYRHDPTAQHYTAEVELARTNGADSIVSSYLPQGGVSFLGSNLDNDMNEPTFNRFRAEISSPLVAGAKFSFAGLSAKPVTIASTLAPMDSFIIDGGVTHNFGLKIYSLDKEDQLAPNETLAALYQTDAGESFLGELQGPTMVPQLFHFSRTAVSAWPMSQGTVTLIRRRTSPLTVDGVKGTLVEEVYSKPQRTGVFN